MNGLSIVWKSQQDFISVLMRTLSFKISNVMYRKSICSPHLGIFLLRLRQSLDSMNPHCRHCSNRFYLHHWRSAASALDHFHCRHQHLHCFPALLLYIQSHHLRRHYFRHHLAFLLHHHLFHRSLYSLRRHFQRWLFPLHHHHPHRHLSILKNTHLNMLQMWIFRLKFFTCASFVFDDRDSLRARFTGVLTLSSLSKTYSFGSSPSSVIAYFIER